MKHFKKSIIIVCFVILTSCFDSENTNSKNDNTVSCCKMCSKGKACGNSCISKIKNCTKNTGCACNSKPSQKFVGLPTSIPDVIVSHIQDGYGLTFSSGSEYGVVSQEGYYTHEVNEDVTFSFDDYHLIRNPKKTKSVYDFYDTLKGQYFIEILIKKDADHDLSNGIQKRRSG